MRRAPAALFLILASVAAGASGACRKDPVLGADVDLSAASAPSGQPSASGSASSSPKLSRPPLIQHAMTGFPACVVDPPLRQERIPHCKQVRNVVCYRYPERQRTIFDENQIAMDLRLPLAACLRSSLLPSSVAWVTIGILPSGRICAPSFASSEAPSAQSLSCAAQRLHAYRATVADRSSEVVFKVILQIGAPAVLRETP